MSLINKMLQDLESRKNAPADTTDRKSVYEDLKPVKASGLRAPSSKRLSVILLALVLVGGGAYAWMRWGDRLLSGGPAAVKARPVATHKTPSKAAPAPVATVAATPAASTTEKPKEILASNAQGGNVAEASKAEPKANPAPATVEPKNTSASAPTAVPASEGGYWTVAKGETLYGISTKTGIDLWDLSKWNHLGRHHVIYPGQRLRLTPPDSTAVNSGTSPPDRNNERKKETKKAKITVASVKKPAVKDVAPKAAPVSSPVSEESSAAAGVMDKKVKPLSLDEQAESEYRQAVNLLQKGRAADAEKHLKAALKISAEHPASRELLAGLALQNGRWREAQQILEQGIEKVPAYYPFALLLARTQIEHGANQKALAVMEASRQAGAGSADYMAFLAELYRRAGNPAEAIKAYTEAIKLNPREGRSWLGMGIALEAAQDWNAAGAAYQRAIETGVLDDNLLKYARQRLTVVKAK